MAIGQSTAQYSVDRDLRIIQEMAARLRAYIYEPELYGLMPGDLPRLTLGGLLMRLVRLSALALSAPQREALDKVKSQVEAVKKEWLVAYEGKIGREMKARLMSLHQFLDECPDNVRTCADNFPSAVEKRVMVDALQNEADALNIFEADMKGGIAAVDNKIHRYFQKNDQFVWDAQLKPAYPDDRFWYLYTRPAR